MVFRFPIWVVGIAALTTVATWLNLAARRESWADDLAVLVNRVLAGSGSLLLIWLLARRSQPVRCHEMAVKIQIDQEYRLTTDTGYEAQLHSGAALLHRTRWAWGPPKAFLGALVGKAIQVKACDETNHIEVLTTPGRTVTARATGVRSFPIETTNLCEVWLPNRPFDLDKQGAQWALAWAKKKGRLPAQAWRGARGTRPSRRLGRRSTGPCHCCPCRAARGFPGQRIGCDHRL